MTSIYDIPYKDIEIFLRANGKKLTKNKDDDYENAFILLKNKNSKGHTIKIIEWMKAYNLFINNVNIPSYSIYEIDNMTSTEINSLAKKLTMKGNDRDNIKNILRYLNKLNEYNDESIYDTMLPEIIRRIALNLKYNDIIIF